ncbi:MAG: hypothetical protein ACI9VI_001798, partial [Candidatus Azotimanducaceae bacterium]
MINMSEEKNYEKEEKKPQTRVQSQSCPDRYTR